jgi:hypothetical protein
MTCARAVAFAVFAVACSAALFLPEFAQPLSGGLLRVFGEPGPLALLGSWLINTGSTPDLHPPSAASLPDCFPDCFYLPISLYLFRFVDKLPVAPLHRRFDGARRHCR